MKKLKDTKNTQNVIDIIETNNFSNKYEFIRENKSLVS
jgi:hypothetical protein